MDRGELFKNTFKVEPAVNGGFVVYPYVKHDGSCVFAFTTLDDLMAWLNDQRPPAIVNVNTPVSNPDFIGKIGDGDAKYFRADGTNTFPRGD